MAAVAGRVSETVCVAVEVVEPGSWQFNAQHNRAAVVAGESSCASAALQQSIIASLALECSGTPEVTPPLSAASRTTDMKHFLIANADCTYGPERLSSTSLVVDPDSGWTWQWLCRSEFAGVFRDSQKAAAKINAPACA